MGPRAVGFALDQGGATAGACSGDGFAGLFVDRDHVVSVEFQPRHAVILGAATDVGNGTRLVERDLGGELVVFADENYREVPDLGHVQALVERSVVDGPVAEEADRDAVSSEELGRVAAAGGLQDATGHDAAGAHQPDFGAEQVHAATAAARAACVTAEKLGDQLFGLQPLGQCVAVTAVGAEDDIFPVQVGTDSTGDCLLADVGVAGTVDEPPLVTAGQFLLALPDGLHRAIQVQQGVLLRQRGDFAGHRSCP